MVAEQTWRGHPLVREAYLPDDMSVWFNGPPIVLLAGTREFRRLAWEEDADAWYAAEVARMADRAPA